jgi:hypothetical protein
MRVETPEELKAYAEALKSKKNMWRRKYHKKYYADNKDKIKNEQKKYYRKNRESLLARFKLYYKEHRESLLAYYRNHYQAKKRRRAA